MTVTDSTVSTVATGTVPAFSMRADRLRDVLASALVAADKGDSLPILCAVLLEWADGGTVTVASTDRYRMVVADTGTVGAGAARVLVGRQDVEALVKLLPKKPARGWANVSDVSVTVAGGHVVVRMDGPDGSWSRECRIVDGDFPKYRTLVPIVDRSGEAPAVSSFAWNPIYMAGFAKLPLAVERQAMRWHFTSPSKPAVAFLGDVEQDGYALTVLLMPVRLTS